MENKESYLAQSTVVSAMGILLLLMFGWLFTLVVDNNRRSIDKQEKIVERISVLEAKVFSMKGRVDRLDKRSQK